MNGPVSLAPAHATPAHGDALWYANAPLHHPVGSAGPVVSATANPWAGSDAALAFQNAMAQASPPSPQSGPGGRSAARSAPAATDAPWLAPAPHAAPSVLDLARVQYQGLLGHAFDLPPGFDVREPGSALLALRWQVEHSNAVLRYHVLLQAASSVTRSIRSLSSLQG